MAKMGKSIVKRIVPGTGVAAVPFPGIAAHPTNLIVTAPDYVIAASPMSPEQIGVPILREDFFTETGLLLPENDD